MNIGIERIEVCLNLIVPNIVKIVLFVSTISIWESTREDIQKGLYLIAGMRIEIVIMTGDPRDISYQG